MKSCSRARLYYKTLPLQFISNFRLQVFEKLLFFEVKCHIGGRGGQKSAKNAKKTFFKTNTFSSDRWPEDHHHYRRRNADSGPFPTP